jgi:uncharacterized tellurite resistance protein B-like protein
MMRQIRNLLRPKTPAEKTLDPYAAIAALLVEAALADGVYVNIESDMIAEVLIEAFNMEAARADALMAQGEALAEEAVGAHQFTRHVKKLSLEDRVRVIETLYRVILADHAMSPEEDAFVRHVASLLHVDDVLRAQARRKAKAPGD